MRGATVCIISRIAARKNFNPRAPCGARLIRRGIISAKLTFQSTRPMRGATILKRSPASQTWISIHAPHAGRDRLHKKISVQSFYFNPRAPCGARRTPVTVGAGEPTEFQSTRPMRGATSKNRLHAVQVYHFNPRAPCGARPISTVMGTCSVLFQSTRPMRGATTDERQGQRHQQISIHAPHAGRDLLPAMFLVLVLHFNPRAPCGARLAGWCNGSTPHSISIHAPHAGRDNIFLVFLSYLCRFQSTRPMRGATSYGN